MLKVSHKKKSSKNSSYLKSTGGTASKELEQTPLMKKTKAKLFNLKDNLYQIKIGKKSTHDVVEELTSMMQYQGKDTILNEINSLKKRDEFNTEILQIEKLLNVSQLQEIKAAPEEDLSKEKKETKPTDKEELIKAKQEIEKHLEVFSKGGAHAFISALYHKGFSGKWGDWEKENDKNFIAPLPEANKIVDKALKAEGFRTLEKKLGLQKWSLYDKCPEGIIYRYIIPQNKVDSIASQMAHAYVQSKISKDHKTTEKEEVVEKSAIVNFFKGKDAKEFQNAILTGVVKIEELDLSEQTPEPEKNKFASVRKG